jgi:uncharacterized protein
MWSRPAWQARIEAAWAQRNVVWLMGVRRTGKTVLCRSLPQITYFDCELPSVRRQLVDPESFLRTIRKGRIVLDEVHRLGNPSELLKIAADHFPDVRVVATGSSTLGASARFRDTLAGRKREVWLTPMTMADLDAAGGTIGQRLVRGGLPAMFEAGPDGSQYQEWVDAYWAKDILELFRLERRHSFQRLLELLFVQSGGIFEATSLTSPCEVSRTTIANYLAVLEATFVVHVVRPFSGNPSREVIAAPRVYGFDTGFVRVFRGFADVRPEDEGELFEHLVLNEIHARMQKRSVMYWRTKRGEEIDFVLAEAKDQTHAIECKRCGDDFDPRALRVFRELHPGGRNYVVAMDVTRTYERRYGELTVRFVDLPTLVEEVVARSGDGGGRRRPTRRRT